LIIKIDNRGIFWGEVEATAISPISPLISTFFDRKAHPMTLPWGWLPGAFPCRAKKAGNPWLDKSRPWERIEYRGKKRGGQQEQGERNAEIHNSFGGIEFWAWFFLKQNFVLMLI
jgi:hypothetical protein